MEEAVNNSIDSSFYKNADNLNFTTVTCNITNGTNCTTNSQVTFGRNEDLAKLEIAIQAVIFFLAVFGNGTVLLVLCMRRKKLSRMNMMIIHLSIADLFVAFFNVLPQLIWDITYRFYGGDFLCRSVKYFQVVAMYASSYVLVTTAIDRFLVICFPLSAQTWSDKRTHMIVMVAWCLSLLFSIPQAVIFSYQEVSVGSNTYDCWATFNPEWTLQAYITWITLAIFVIPLFLLIGFYGRICYVVWQSMKMKEPTISRKEVKQNGSNGTCENGQLLSESKSNSGRTVCNPRAHVRGVSKAKVKTVKLTLTVIMCYLVCWGPFFVAQMWAAWDIHAPFTGEIMTIILLLASLNSCTNPWIYLAYSGETMARFVERCRGKQSLGRKTLNSDSDFKYTSRTVHTTLDSQGSSSIAMKGYKS